MTKDELIERVAKVISARSDLGMAYHRNRARTVVALMMPPPLVWRDNPDNGEGGFLANGPFETVYHAMADGWSLHRMGSWYDADGLPAAQAAAQAHADAAWIANTRAAQGAEK